MNFQSDDACNKAYRWWKSTGGLLIDAQEVFSSSVALSPIVGENDLLRPLLIGDHSLPAKVLESTDIADLVESLSFQSSYADEVHAGYRHCLANAEPLSARHLCVGKTTHGIIDIQISKLALPVRTPQGGRLILSVSEQITFH